MANYTFRQAFENHYETLFENITKPIGVKKRSFYSRHIDGDIWKYNPNTLLPCHKVEIFELIELLNSDFILVEAVKQKNGLGIKNGDIQCYSRGESEAKEDRFEVFQIRDALNTYIELLSHPLIVRINNHIQFSFRPVYQHDNATKILFISSICTESSKMRCFAPLFDSEENTQIAIKDIGEDKLISMFSKLKGI